MEAAGIRRAMTATPSKVVPTADSGYPSPRERHVVKYIKAPDAESHALKFRLAIISSSWLLSGAEV